MVFFNCSNDSSSSRIAKLPIHLVNCRICAVLNVSAHHLVPVNNAGIIWQTQVGLLTDSVKWLNLISNNSLTNTHFQFWQKISVYESSFKNSASENNSFVNYINKHKTDLCGDRRGDLYDWLVVVSPFALWHIWGSYMAPKPHLS